MANNFKVGDAVLYQNGDRFELGIVKEVVEHRVKQRLRQDGLYGKPTGEEIVETCYRVWYHTGDTTALTNEWSLHSIANAYAFNISRITVD